MPPPKHTTSLCWRFLSPPSLPAPGLPGPRTLLPREGGNRGVTQMRLLEKRPGGPRRLGDARAASHGATGPSVGGAERGGATLALDRHRPLRGRQANFRLA